MRCGFAGNLRILSSKTIEWGNLKPELVAHKLSEVVVIVSQTRLLKSKHIVGNAHAIKIQYSLFSAIIIIYNVLIYNC